MWIVTRNLIRRQWFLLPLGLFLTSMAFLILLARVSLEPNATEAEKNLLWFAYFAYGAVALFYSNAVGTEIIRVYRTLPLRDSSLANLMWSVTALAPPLLQGATALPVALLLTASHPMGTRVLSATLLYLVVCTLISGLFAFMNTLASPYSGPPGHARGVHRLMDAHPGKLFMLALLAGALMIYRAPWHWSNLGWTHIIGMALAAALAWMSYRTRLSLAYPVASSHTSDEPFDPDQAPRRAASLRSWLARDLAAHVGKKLLWLLLPLGSAYLASLYIGDRGGFQGMSGWLAGMAVVISAGDLSRIAKLSILRTLPLTANQSIFLLLVYPYGSFLVVIPFAAAALWVAGLGGFWTLLFWGILLGGAFAPFALLLYARFGSSAASSLLVLISIGAMVAGIFVHSKWDTDLAAVQRLIGWTAGVLLAAIGLTGYLGLRYLIENSSALYKRKLSDPEDD